MVKKIIVKNGEIPCIKECVACIGYFDGVHLGHQQLIKQTINNEFEEFQGTSGLIEKGWSFTGNSEIQEICNKIIDAKIKKLQNS